jgi:hypothetical protein
MEEHDPSKWHWMMKWCREIRVPPGDSYWWKRAGIWLTMNSNLKNNSATAQENNK